MRTKKKVEYHCSRPRVQSEQLDRSAHECRVVVDIKRMNLSRSRRITLWIALRHVMVCNRLLAPVSCVMQCPWPWRTLYSGLLRTGYSLRWPRRDTPNWLLNNNADGSFASRILGQTAVIRDQINSKLHHFLLDSLHPVKLFSDSTYGITVWNLQQTTQ
jgi:hypothetical protein